METGNSPLPLEWTTDEDQSKSDTENFLVCPVEIRNQLVVLLEIPRLL